MESIASAAKKIPDNITKMAGKVEKAASQALQSLTDTVNRSVKVITPKVNSYAKILGDKMAVQYMLNSVKTLKDTPKEILTTLKGFFKPKTKTEPNQSIIHAHELNLGTLELQMTDAEKKIHEAFRSSPLSPVAVAKNPKLFDIFLKAQGKSEEAVLYARDAIELLNMTNEDEGFETKLKSLIQQSLKPSLSALGNDGADKPINLGADLNDKLNKTIELSEKWKLNVEQKKEIREFLMETFTNNKAGIDKESSWMSPIGEEAVVGRFLNNANVKLS